MATTATAIRANTERSTIFGISSVSRCNHCRRIFNVERDRTLYNDHFGYQMDYDYICEGEICAMCGIAEAEECLNIATTEFLLR